MPLVVPSREAKWLVIISFVKMNVGATDETLDAQSKRCWLSRATANPGLMGWPCARLQRTHRPLRLGGPAISPDRLARRTDG